jgi:hypothetical protein
MLGLSNVTTTSNNTSVGAQALQLTTGSNNTAVGFQSGNSITTSSDNALFGYASGIFNTGSQNVALGSMAMYGSPGSSTSSNTVAVGYQALTALTTGTGNTAVGYQAGAALTTGNSNTLFGYSAGGVMTTTGGLTAVGFEAGRDTSGGYGNTYYGYRAGDTHTGHNSQTMIGVNARNGATSGDDCLAIGSNSYVYGSNQTAVGPSAQTANGGTAIGSGSRAGSYAVAIGQTAGSYSRLNNYSAHVGARSGNDGQYSVALGYDSLAASSTSGQYNVALGYASGLSITSGSSNILIGYQAGSTLTTESNKLYIENSNSTTPLIYGEFDNDIVRVNGTLQVNDPSSTGYAFPTATGTLGQVLEVDASGDLVFATPSGGGGGGLGSADQTLTADRTIDTNGYNLDIELDPTGTADTFTIHDGTHDLFQVDTTTSGTLFSVNDVSGLPVFQSNDDGSAVLPKILTAAPTGTATEGTMQLGIVSGTCYLYVYINGGWKSTTLT